MNLELTTLGRFIIPDIVLKTLNVKNLIGICCLDGEMLLQHPKKENNTYICFIDFDQQMQFPREYITNIQYGSYVDIKILPDKITLAFIANPLDEDFEEKRNQTMTQKKCRTRCCNALKKSNKA